MRMDPPSRFYTTLSAFSIKLTLHVSKMAFHHVVLGPIATFLLGCSSEGLTVVVLRRKGKVYMYYENAMKSNRSSRSARLIVQKAAVKV